MIERCDRQGHRGAFLRSPRSGGDERALGRADCAADSAEAVVECRVERRANGRGARGMTSAQKALKDMDRLLKEGQGLRRELSKQLKPMTVFTDEDMRKRFR